MEKKERNRLLKLLEGSGWTIRYNGRHFVCRPPEKGVTPVVVVATSVHMRGRLNCFAEIKRRGYGHLLKEL